MTGHIYMNVDQDGITGGLQLSIGAYDETGAGHGYRIAGPRYSGTGRKLLKRRLTERDAQEIRAYLDQEFPVSP